MRSLQKKQRLAVVMFTDMVGYSALAGKDENLSRELVEEHRAVIRKSIASFEGEEITTTGDGFMIEFSSALQATQCAIDIQTTFFERNLTRPRDRQILIRVGLHLGDIHETDEDRFGNEVNIAARVEPLAPPGGICMTRQVVDQIQRKVDFPITSLGVLPLKNIEVPPEVFQLVLPWEARPFRLLDLFHVEGVTRLLKRAKMAFSKSHSTEGKIVGLQLFGTIAMIAWMAFEVSQVLTFQHPSNAKRFVLPTSWQYSSMDRSPGETRWKPFDVNNTAQYADELHGDYALKLEFTGEFAYDHPSLIVGMVAETHRAYLNGQFIGGSENHTDIAKYSFDPGLLKPGETNTLLIQARSKPTLYPGLHPLPGIPSFIGEFEDTSQVISNDEVSFHILESIFLSFSLLIAFASLCSAFFQKSDLKYFYFSLLLFLGSLHLSYHNRFVMSALPYQVSYFSHLLAFGWSGFALFSIDLHARGKRKEEWVNNLVAMISGGAAAVYLLAGDLQPSEYVSRYRVLFSILTLYNRAWIVTIALRGVKRLYEIFRNRANPEKKSLDTIFVFTFGLVILLICNSSSLDAASNHATGIAAYFARSSPLIRFLSKTYPFIFALFVLFQGVISYIRKSQEAAYKHRKDELILGITAMTATCKDAAEATGVIQSKIAEFLKASRSTIYLVEEEPEQLGLPRIHPDKHSLRATYFYGPDPIKKRIEALVGPDQGIIGHVIKNRSPIWVEDIKTDTRFLKEMALPKTEATSYQTGSFIIVPLVFAGKLLGVITVADRKDLKSFTQEDFCLMLLASKDLAIILGSQKRFQSEPPVLKAS